MSNKTILCLESQKNCGRRKIRIVQFLPPQNKAQLKYFDIWIGDSASLDISFHGESAMS